MQFDLARWVCPAASPAAAEIAVDALACIVPSDSGLGEAQRERDDVQALAASAGSSSTQPGCTIGQAVRQAQRHVRDAAPHNPTWLAYTLYAHPNAPVRLGRA